MGHVPRAGPLVKQFCELALSREDLELAFRMPKRMRLLDEPQLGGWGGPCPVMLQKEERQVSGH